jgi:hypothetical protein
VAHPDKRHKIARAKCPDDLIEVFILMAPVTIISWIRDAEFLDMPAPTTKAVRPTSMILSRIYERLRSSASALLHMLLQSSCLQHNTTKDLPRAQPENVKGSDD